MKKKAKTLEGTLGKEFDLVEIEATLIHSARQNFTTEKLRADAILRAAGDALERVLGVVGAQLTTRLGLPADVHFDLDASGKRVKIVPRKPKEKARPEPVQDS